MKKFMTVELENKGISTACLEVLPKEIVFSIKKNVAAWFSCVMLHWIKPQDLQNNS